MQTDVPVYQGILLLHSQGVFHLKRTYHKKFCQLFDASKYGIKRLEVYDNEEEASSYQMPQRIVTLEACVKIALSNQPNFFTVHMKNSVENFGCISETDMLTWFKALQSVAFKVEDRSPTLEEENELYSCSGEGIFAVKLVDTEASKRCGIEPKNYTLIASTVEMKLMDNETLVLAWPYRHIRKYGSKGDRFTFEAGRKCKSGEGDFCLIHNGQQGIFRCISSRMKTMKKLVYGEVVPNIEFNEDQLNAVLTMAAGSRTPLPPSPNSSANPKDLKFSTIPQMSHEPTDVQEQSTSKSPPIVKPKPSKPPRKYIFSSLLEKKSLELNLSDNRKYKKLNSKSSPELERKSNDDDSVDDVVGESTSEKNDENQSPYEIVTLAPLEVASPIIYNNFVDKLHPDYDKLQHFGSRSKLNINSNYKTLVGILAEPDSDANEGTYEVVSDMSTARLVDDGNYGVIRMCPDKSGESKPKHKVYNNSEYAIVSKPKNV